MPLSEQDHKDMVGKDNEFRASYGNGTTTQGGSNYGQGSSNLGGPDVVKQGSEAGKGANYENEKDKLGNSSVGTNNEGSSSPDRGAAGSEVSEAVKENSKKGEPGWNGEEERSDTRRKQDVTPDDAARAKEGDRKDTSARNNTGAWSEASSMEEN